MVVRQCLTKLLNLYYLLNISIAEFGLLDANAVLGIRVMPQGGKLVYMKCSKLLNLRPERCALCCVVSKVWQYAGSIPVCLRLKARAVGVGPEREERLREQVRPWGRGHADGCKDNERGELAQ